MINIKIPSKTFLVGEYVALSDGPALLLNTGPQFTYEINLKESDINQVEFHKDSPSGKYFAENNTLFTNCDFNFIDPHENKGGFGASGAKFAGLVAMQNIIAKQGALNALQVRNLLLKNSSTKQSGYDVIAQMSGEVTHIDLKNKIAQASSWTFKDLAVTIVRTGHKITTHEHLKSVKLNNLNELEDIAVRTINAFKYNDASEFTSQVNSYYSELVKQKLICEDSRALVAKIKREFDLCYSVKACGAAGADTILMIHDLSVSKKVKKYFEKINLEIVFSGNNFSSGMEINGADDLGVHN